MSVALTPFDFLAIASALQGASGFSLKSWLDSRNKDQGPSQLDDTGFLRSVLAGCDDPTDPLTGYWELFDWPVPARSESMRGRRIERGSLVLFYRTGDNRSWRGLLTHTTAKADGVNDGPHSEPPFFAAYDVELGYDKGLIGGSLVFRDKAYLKSTKELEARVEEQKKAHHMGQFYGCQVQGSGATAKFFGRYETMRRTGEIEFLFRQRKRWADLQSVPGVR